MSSEFFGWACAAVPGGGEEVVLRFRKGYGREPIALPW